ncbi:MAG: hypothetical protein D6718_00900, partial [Acidobacteria bacterium]
TTADSPGGLRPHGGHGKPAQFAARGSMFPKPGSELLGKGVRVPGTAAAVRRRTSVRSDAIAGALENGRKPGSEFFAETVIFVRFLQFFG